MLDRCDLIAFCATTDIDRARRFFGDTLGLRRVEEAPFADVYDAHGTTLRVTRVDAVVPAPYTVLGWEVADVAAAVRELAERGVAVEHHEGLDQDDLGVWTAPSGHRVAWFRDPDGNVLSVSQHVRG
jgi:catechol 2,3-dioxygenase-like lactoylglutathione lyase family enzyme